MNQPKHLFRRVIDFFGIQKNLGGLLIMVILVGLGEKMAERFLPIYIMALGGGSLIISTLNGMDNLLGALYSLPGGYISDRFGHKRALAFFNIIAMIGYLIVIIFPSWQAVLIGAVFFLSWTAISLPATMSLVSAVMPKNKRTMGVSLNSLVKRIPMSLGPLLGGTLIALYGEKDGVRLAFIVALALAVIALFLQQRLIDDDRPLGKAEISPLKLFTRMSPELRGLLSSDILVRFAEQIPYAFVVVWAIKIIKISPVEFGVLTVIEMITAVLIYIPVAYLADKRGKKPFVLITFGFFALFPILLYFSRSFGLLVIAFIVRGLKEFGEPTRKALIMDLAPEDQKAGMFGVYYLVRDVIVSLAAFAAGFLWDISPLVNFAVASGFGVLGLLVFAIFGKDLPVSARNQG